jgi:hypothetical protein
VPPPYKDDCVCAEDAYRASSISLGRHSFLTENVHPRLHKTPTGVCRSEEQARWI